MPKQKKKIRLECHGGPMDGDWVSMEPGMTHLDVRLGPGIAKGFLPRATTIQGTLELANTMLQRGRTGRYLVQGYKPWAGSAKYQQVLRWEGEL